MGERNLEFLPNMVQSVSYQTYAPNPNFPNGMTQQLPEPGTIARGHLPLHYSSSPTDAIRAGAELHSPFAPSDKRARERGAFVYANYCLVCHGPQGKGDGPVLERGVPLPASLLGERAVQMKDGQMFHVLTYGQGNMPPYAAQLARDDRWRVILHVRSLQQQSSGIKPP
jgi:mono/diheme cytochrome c family protein